jgi:hypothetical protein
MGIFRRYRNFAAPNTLTANVWRFAMRNYLLGGVAVASAFTFMISAAPASAQGGCGGQPCASRSFAGPSHSLAGPSHSFAGPRRSFAGAGPAQPNYQRYGRGNGNGVGFGLGVGAALATGAIIGGALNQGYYPAESYPVYSDQDAGAVYVDQGPGYYDASPQVASEGDSAAYCQQTYRSYDPASGTYLGYDGLRHSCP